MAKIDTNISPELERRFREVTYQEFGLHRGCLRKAAEEALTLWIKSKEKGGN